MHQLEELSLELTNECNLACIHCSSGSTPEKLPNELTPLEHASLIGQARKLGATVLSLSGGNPLLCEHLPGLVALACELGYERVLIYTTGHPSYTADTIDRCEFVSSIMRREQVTWIFSMHSHIPTVCNSIMVKPQGDPNTLAQIEESISWLTVQGENVEVHMVPMQPNYRHIRGVRNLCRQLRVSKLSLLRFVPQTRGSDNVDVLGMDKIDFAWMQVAIATEMESAHSVELRAGCPIDFRHAMGLIKEKEKPCHAGDDLILVRPDGSVHPCAAWKSLPSDDNVRTSDLHTIWHESTVFNGVRKFKAEGYGIVSSCSKCPSVHSCKTGCLAQRLHACALAAVPTLDDLYGPYGDPLCPRLPSEV